MLGRGQAGSIPARWVWRRVGNETPPRSGVVRDCDPVDPILPTRRRVTPVNRQTIRIVGICGGVFPQLERLVNCDTVSESAKKNKLKT